MKPITVDSALDIADRYINGSVSGEVAAVLAAEVRRRRALVQALLTALAVRPRLPRRLIDAHAERLRVARPMNDRTVTLLGTEAVQRAGSSMRSSAETIERAASSLSYTLEQHQRFMDDWLQRFEQALTEFAKALKENTP